MNVKINEYLKKKSIFANLVMCLFLTSSNKMQGMSKKYAVGQVVDIR